MPLSRFVDKKPCVEMSPELKNNDDDGCVTSDKMQVEIMDQYIQMQTNITMQQHQLHQIIMNLIRINMVS